MARNRLADRSARGAPLIAIELPLRTSCIAAAVFCVVLHGITVAPAPLATLLEGELGIVETVSALAYPVGAWFALRLARETRGWASAHWVMWVFLCVLFFGEETSWLQHWLGYETPERVRALNVQSEFNLHNLAIWASREALVGSPGFHLSWRQLLSAQSLFYAGFATYFLLIPLATRIRPLEGFPGRLGVPRLGTGFLLMAWVPIVYSAVVTVVYAHDAARRALIGETREMFFALVVALFVALAHRSARASR